MCRVIRTTQPGRLRMSVIEGAEGRKEGVSPGACYPENRAGKARDPRGAAPEGRRRTDDGVARAVRPGRARRTRSGPDDASAAAQAALPMSFRTPAIREGS